MEEEKRDESVQDCFHKTFFHQHFCRGTDVDIHWMGVPVEKCPMDLWAYQEILWQLQPDLIIETGTGRGGTTLYLASLLDSLEKGRIISIDIATIPSRPQHSRISYLTGNSVSSAIVNDVRAQASPSDRVMVILDSEHAKSHVLSEMKNYAPLVTSGSYLIVEDTHFNGNPVPLEKGPGPLEAVDEFLTDHYEFQPDRSREKYMLTFNPKGYLLKTG